MTFPDNNQPDMPFAAVGSEGFVSSLTGRRIWGYLSIPTSVAMPVTAVCLDDRTVVEFEVGAPPADPPLTVKMKLVNIKISSDPIFESAGGGGESPEPTLTASSSVGWTSSTHEKSIDND